MVDGIDRVRIEPLGQLPEPPRETGIIAWIKRIFSSSVKRNMPPLGAMAPHQFARLEERGFQAAISRLFRKLFGGSGQAQSVQSQVAPEALKNQVLVAIEQQIKCDPAIGASEILKALIPHWTHEQCGHALLDIFANAEDLNKIEKNHTSDLLRLRDLVEELLKVDADAMLGRDDETQQVIQRRAVLWIPLVVQTIINEIRRDPANNNNDLWMNKFDTLITPLSKMRVDSTDYEAVKEQVKKQVLSHRL